MGLFSSGSSKRAGDIIAQYLELAKKDLGAANERYQTYYDPYREYGEGALSTQQDILTDTGERITGLDPKIAALYEERAALQPQVSEVYSLAQQADPVVQEILSGGAGFETSPGYQFRMEEGQKALERSRAAQGTLSSGATGKALTRYAQGVASDEYGNYMSRLNDSLNAINSQLSGRTTALNAGQSQINQGVNLLGQDINQITTQQALGNQYQALVNSGLSASDAAARLGMSAAQLQAALTAQQGDALAGGMIANSNLLLGQGQGLLTGAGALSTLGGGSSGGGIGLGGLGNIGQIGGLLGGGSQTTFEPGGTIAGGYDSSLPWKASGGTGSVGGGGASSYGQLGGLASGLFSSGGSSSGGGGWAGGAMSGAQTGSAFGPWGTLIGAVAGGLLGEFA